MAKRSCDFCVRRKTKCDNNRPCQKCLEAKPPLQCTYLKPVLKRGPKTSKLTRGFDKGSYPHSDLLIGSALSGSHCPLLIPHQALVPVIKAYRSHLYPVWPVVNVSSLVARLEASNLDAYILAVSLCSATMAQLNLAPFKYGGHEISSSLLEKECSRMRLSNDYRSNPSIDSVLASFFCHVYHAKIDNRNAGMMFLQEALSMARLLRLDDIEGVFYQQDAGGLDEKTSLDYLLYVLLWVSERGYAMQHRFPVSAPETLFIPPAFSHPIDVYQEGLLELARLFVSFDVFFKRSRRIGSKWAGHSLLDTQFMLLVHESLAKVIPRPTSNNAVQRADFQVTKQWMRISLWQKSKSQGLLSDSSEVEPMTLLFPSQVAYDLLSLFATISKRDLLPLGRDQLCKSLEVTNTLADTILALPTAQVCSVTGNSWARDGNSHQSARSSYMHVVRRERGRCGPPDFLHHLFQAIFPLLEDDENLRTALHHKIAEALRRSVEPKIPTGCGDVTERDDPHSQKDLEVEMLWHDLADLPMEHEGICDIFTFGPLACDTGFFAQDA